MTIKLKGSTDGSVSLSAPADTSPTGTDITLTLPTDAGSANQFLKNSGTAGTLDYSSMVEDSSGNVAIGTTSSSTRFRVDAGTTSNATAAVLLNDSTSAYATTDDGLNTILNLSSTGTNAAQAVGIGFSLSKSGETGAISEIGAIREGNGMSGLVFRTRDSSTGRNERMRIDSSGNVGIGTTSPAGKLAVSDGTVTGEINPYSASSTCFIGTRSNHSISFQVNASEKVRINSSGQLLLGTTAGGAKLVVGAVSQSSATRGAVAIKAVQDQNNLPTNIYLEEESGSEGYQLSIDADGDLNFHNSGATTPTVTFSDDDKVGIGTASPTNKLHIFGDGSNANFRSVQNPTTSVTHCVFSNNNGDVGSISTSGSSTTYATSSDHRLKENVVDIVDGITRVKQLQPKRFNFIADADTTVDGFIAHEAQTVVPEAVTGTHNEVDDDGNAVMQGIDQSKLVPLLTAALQEAIAKIETLETKVAALEAA